jgi:hypothetical protein
MSTPTAWANLPNAAHIDWVLRTLRSHPQVWGAARDAAWTAAHGAAWTASQNAAWTASRGAAWAASRDVAHGAAHGGPRGAVCALIAWDDASRWLCTHWAAADMAAKDGDQRALLMQTAARVAWELGYAKET